MKKTIPILSVLTLLTFFSCNEVVYNEPKQLINQEIAKDLNIRYIKERSNIIYESIKKEDANAAWYSLEELENYINYVKTEGKKNNIKVNGIRLYLGVYPNDSTKYQEKAGLTTIFLSPTMSSAESSNLQSVAKFTSRRTSDENIDVTSIQPMNYGGIGNPPKVEYPNQQ